MSPAWLLLAAKLAIELKPAISHLIKRNFSKYEHICFGHS